MIEPAPFAAVIPSRSAVGSVLELRSSGSGRVEKRLGTFGQSFTNKGPALSPDGQDVYFTLIGKRRDHDLLLERVAVAGEKRSFVAYGEQPAVSPDSKLLAYVTGNSANRPARAGPVATGARRSPPRSVSS